MSPTSRTPRRGSRRGDDTRKAACTHTKAARQYNDQFECHHCGQHPENGWLYRCAQDSDGRIPIPENGYDTQDVEDLIQHASSGGWFLPGIAPGFHERSFYAEDDVADLSKLKPWMLKAVFDQQYTAEEISILISQRMKVREVIQTEDLRVRKAEEKRVEAAFQGYDGHSRDVGFLESFERELETRVAAAKKAYQCDYRCCSNCRPVMRDRAWNSFETFFSPEDPNQYPDDVDARPVTDARIILGIGRPKQNLTPTYSIESMESMEYSDTDEMYAQELRGHIVRRRSSSFLDSVRRVFKDFVDKAGPRSRSVSAKSDEDESESSSLREVDITDVAGLERFAALSVARPESRMGESWMADAVSSGDLSRLSPGILQHMHHDSIANILGTIATQRRRTSSPSPQLNEVHKHSENTENGEIHVAEGIAVTEEALDLGFADIMTQA